MSTSSRLAAALCLGLCSTPILAQTASSSAYALSAEERVTALGVADVNVSVGPNAAVSGSAPPAYNVSGGVASISENASLSAAPFSVDQALSTGIVTTNANGTATGAEATATINNLSFALNGLVLDPALLSLGATTLQSFSQANSVGGLDASGTTTIEGLILTGSVLGGLTIDGSLFVNPAPNTVLFSGAGLEIILNEQILGGDGLTGIGITTNALRVSFDDFLLGSGLANGDIIVGQTQAFASVGAAGAVPEPGTWAMMLMGFGAVGASLRKARRSQLALASA